NRIVVDIKYARLFARCRTYTSGEFGEIVGPMQPVHRFAPTAAVNQVIPVGYYVSKRAPLMAEGDAAVHTAGALRLQLIGGHLEFIFAPVGDTFTDRTTCRRLAFDLHEDRDLAH